jgi:uncharacterized protein (DUF433 family)
MSQQPGGVETELMDEPHVAGHRVSVRRVRGLVEERGLGARAVADRLGIDVSDVYRALAYYHDNPRKMADVERRRERRTEASRERGAVTGPEEL